MDAQHLIDALFGICGILVGAVLKTMWADLKSQTATIAALNEKLGREYVRRDDYRDDITEMKGMLARIFDKLDDKQDKP
jgi:antirestriction protein